MAVQATRVTNLLTPEILRFRRSERELHWAIALPFMVCYTTAAILVVVYHPVPTRPYHAVFSWIHRISGVCLAVGPGLAIVRHWRDFRLHVRNVARAWTWSWDDVRWLALMGPATFNSRVTLPHQDKFNAGEKINFVALTLCYPVYVATGVSILLPGTPFVSWIIHVCLASFVATPLMLGHIFMAVVNPDTRVGLMGMITGFVDREWARHHYHHWYEELYGERAPAAPAAAIDKPWCGATPDIGGVHGGLLASEEARPQGGESISGEATASTGLPVASPGRNVDAGSSSRRWLDLATPAGVGK